MKIFCPTTARRAHTLELMGDRVTYVVHTQEQRELLAKHCIALGMAVEPRMPTIIVSGLPMVKDPSMIRDWIEENLVKEGEYYASMDDDIQGFRGYNTLDRSSSYVMRDPWRILECLESLRDEMLDEGRVLYGGFSMIDNPYFLQSRFKYRTLVSSNVFVTRKDSAVKWKLDPGVTIGSDLARSLASIVLTGKAMADGRRIVVTELGVDSDLGTCAERPYLKLCERLCELFPDIAVIEKNLLKLRPSQPKIDAWWKKFEFVNGEVHARSALS